MRSSSDRAEVRRAGTEGAAVLRSWAELAGVFEDVTRSSGAGLADGRLAFARGRFEEGREIGRFLEESRPGARLRVLDLGSGNGGVALALANRERMAVTALDHRPNVDLLALRREADLPLAAAVGDGRALPFASRTFEVVLCLETVEHVSTPERMAREIWRVLAPGGVCMLTTPARCRHLLARDPHFGIPGLLLLPDSLQRWVATRLLRRVDPGDYDVVHVFWHAGSLARLFPEPRTFQAVGGPKDSRWWSFWQRLFWSRLLVHKPVPDGRPLVAGRQVP